MQTRETVTGLVRRVAYALIRQGHLSSLEIVVDAAISVKPGRVALVTEAD